ncbi:hypothetical protein EV356DRAFT_309911 [Viridothelium virens]|uniref:Uncharacterized protein n=1 Tax=Viridothelium virens TaxID=1048519 RepID=A0A6A6H0Q0_VIRVR|nr:hypothetical protein EV356DRAFT_309911 [Viridothelium virens]
MLTLQYLFWHCALLLFLLLLLLLPLLQNSFLIVSSEASPQISKIGRSAPNVLATRFLNSAALEESTSFEAMDSLLLTFSSCTATMQAICWTRVSTIMSTAISRDCLRKPRKNTGLSLFRFRSPGFITSGSQSLTPERLTHYIVKFAALRTEFGGTREPNDDLDLRGIGQSEL